MLRRMIMLLPFVIAGCSRGPEADLQYISDARSLAAEWALINEQAMKGHLTNAYVRTMRESLRKQLKTTSGTLSQPRSDYGHEIASLLGAPDTASPGELRAHASKLKQIEDSLESS